MAMVHCARVRRAASGVVPVSDWTRRAYDPRTDEDAIVYLWLKSFAHARENVQRGAHRDASIAEHTYWHEHVLVVERLLDVAETVVLCDPERCTVTAAGPAVLMAFACFTDDVVHYVSVKRRYAREGFGPEMVADLLGERLERPCLYTHELTEMRPGVDLKGQMRAQCGVAVPPSWRAADPYWLAREFAGGARVAA